MSDDYNVQVDELLYEAAGLEDGPSKIALLEEAVRLADTHGDGYRGYEVRQQLIHTATFGGYPEKALVAFTWCLAQCDREREGRLDYTMMWKYKWEASSRTWRSATARPAPPCALSTRSAAPPRWTWASERRRSSTIGRGSVPSAICRATAP